MNEENGESSTLYKTIQKSIFRITLLPIMGMVLILIFVPLVKPFPRVYDPIVLGVTMMADVIVDLALFSAFYSFGLIFLDLLEWFSDNMNVIVEIIKEHKEKQE